jgi:hypothetical protein
MTLSKVRLRVNMPLFFFFLLIVTNYTAGVVIEIQIKRRNSFPPFLFFSFSRFSLFVRKEVGREREEKRGANFDLLFLDFTNFFSFLSF